MSNELYTFPHEDTDSLNDFYGDPRGRGGRVSPSWYKQNIVRWKPIYPLYYSDGGSPLRTLLLHKLCVPAYNAAFAAALKHFGSSGIRKHRLNICGGTYNYRVMRGGSRLSTHAYAIAIDIDPENNPFPHRWTKDGLNIDFANILMENGLWWRGYQGDVDPMHFQCAYRGRKPKEVDVATPVVTNTFEEKPHPAEEVSLVVEDHGIPGTIYNFFVTNGYTPEQSCGIVANVQAESDFDINNVGDGGRARGLFQMHPDRRSVVWTGAKCNMRDGGVEEQCRGALWELHHVELRANRMLKKAETAFEAGYNFCRYYERPASQHEWTKRGNYAEKWLDKFKDVKVIHKVGSSKPLSAFKSKNDTRWVQKVLNLIYDVDLDVDGIVGKKTKYWVEVFQKDYGLKVDGDPGPDTKAALKDTLSQI